MFIQILIIFVSGICAGVLFDVLVRSLIRVLHKRSAVRSVSPSSSQIRWWQAQWIHPLIRRSVLIVAPVLANGLYASFASAQTTLHHIDPVVFSALQLALLLPVAVVLLCFTMRSVTKESVRLGLLGGVPLGIGFICVALSLRTIGIIPTAMLTALDGIVASSIAWLVFHQRLSLYTFLAVGSASVGALLLWWIAPSRWQTDLVAVGCGLLFTIYSSHVERNAIVRGSMRQILPFFGGLFLAMSTIALALALCFGHWQTLQTITNADLGIVLYTGLATVLIPLVISTALLRYLSAVTLAFLAVLEPLISIVFAYLLGSITLGFFGWCGVSFILLSILLQASAGRPHALKTQREGADPAIEGALMVSGSAE